jgi:hypothetical protein
MKLKTLLGISLIMPLLLSCNNEIENQPAPAQCHTYVRFVSPSGTNVLDSLNVMPKNEGIQLDSATTQLMTINVNRSSDNVALTLIGKHWLFTSTESDVNLPKDETILELVWHDFKASDTENRARKYDEVYEARMKSPKIFGDDQTHTLRWYARISGTTYDAYKCEIDGREAELANDPFYKEQTKMGVHGACAFINFPCK